MGSNLNFSAKERVINNTFDEMIARWRVSGFYHPKLIEEQSMTNLEKLRNVEVFLNKIEGLKSDLFVSGPLFVRTKEGATLKNIEQPEKVFYPTQYAKDELMLSSVFGNLTYLAQFEIYSVNELSPRIGLFFDKNDANFRELRKLNNSYVLVSPDERNMNLKLRMFYKRVEQAEGRKLDTMPELHTEVIEFLNKKVSTYKEKLAAVRHTQNLDSSFQEKKRKFDKYFIDLLCTYKKLYLFSLNFFIKGPSDGKFNFAEIKKDFFNSFRSNSNLKSIVGYMGTWEYDGKNDFYFRVVFFVEDKLAEEQLSIVHTMIHSWESFNFTRRTKKYSHLFFTAEMSNISESKKSLRVPICRIGKNNNQLISDFSDRVINYITLSEKFFFPAELQIFIFEHLPEDKKKKSERGIYRIENLQYSFSRSFRGHLKKPLN